MKLASLGLQNFRNHRFLELEFEGKTTVIVGANMAGKTNILEAIYLLAMGESFREGKIEAMVAWGEELGRVQGVVEWGEILGQSGAAQSTRFAQDDEFGMKSLPNSLNEIVELEVVVTCGVVQGRRVAKRRFLVNGVGRSRKKLVGNLLVVSFRPEDMRIVEGSPGRRRRFMDEVLVQVDPEYARSLEAYSKGLARRNKLLDMIREGKTQRRALTFWNQLVVKNGEYVQEKRRELSEFFGGGKGRGKRDDRFGQLSLEYKPSVISEKRLAEYGEREIMVGYQLIGPHRDDFAIRQQATSYKEQAGKDLAVYGSRGEQRLGVLWLKVQAMDYVESRLGRRPVLLLDDIFSELDHEHRDLVYGLLERQQTIVTTADEHYVEGFLEQVERVEI